MEGVTGLMMLAEEHSLVGWLVAPDRAHRGPQGLAVPRSAPRPINSRSQAEPTHGMEVHGGPAPNTNTRGNTSAGQRTLKLYKLYKGAAIWLAGFVCITGIYLE